MRTLMLKFNIIFSAYLGFGIKLFCLLWFGFGCCMCLVFLGILLCRLCLGWCIVCRIGLISLRSFWFLLLSCCWRIGLIWFFLCMWELLFGLRRLELRFLGLRGWRIFFLVSFCLEFNYIFVFKDVF